MADNTVVHMGENSPEEVALKLTRILASSEGHSLSLTGNTANVERQWLLDAYSECLQAVRGQRGGEA